VTDAANRLLQQALELEANERAGLAAELLASLDENDTDVQGAWALEIEKRSREASGARGDDWRSVLNEIRATVLNR